MNEAQKEKVAHLWCGNCGSDITDCPEHVLFGCKPKQRRSVGKVGKVDQIYKKVKQ